MQIHIQILIFYFGNKKILDVNHDGKFDEEDVKFKFKQVEQYFYVRVLYFRIICREHIYPWRDYFSFPYFSLLRLQYVFIIGAQSVGQSNASRFVLNSIFYLLIDIVVGRW
jgi:hypothetical protein